VLETLLAADGATVSAEELLERVWDDQTDPLPTCADDDHDAERKLVSRS